MHEDEFGLTHFKNKHEMEDFLSDIDAEAQIEGKTVLIKALMEKGLSKEEAEEEADRQELNKILGSTD